MPQLFGIEHILYLVISILITLLVIVLAKTFLKNEKSQTILIKCLGGVYLFLILLNRYYVSYYWGPVYGGNEPFAPKSFCGVISFFFSISLILCKKNSKVFHCLAYLGLVAGLISTVYANYINQGDTTVFNCPSIFFPPTITSLLHHSFMWGMALLLFVLGWVKPNIKNWIDFPAGWAFLTLYGCIINTIYNRSDGFNNASPIISDLTSPKIFLIVIPFFTLFILIWDAIEYKKDSFFPCIYRKIFKKE